MLGCPLCTDPRCPGLVHSEHTCLVDDCGVQTQNGKKGYTDHLWVVHGLVGTGVSLFREPM